MLALIACEKPRQLGPRDSGVVIGRVIDASSMLPIGNASIKRAQGGIASVSDPRGAFRITLAPGKGFVRVYAPGYQDVLVPTDANPGATVLVPPDGYVRLKPAER